MIVDVKDLKDGGIGQKYPSPLAVGRTHIGQSDPAHIGIIKAVLGHASDLFAADCNLASTNEAASKYRALRAGLLARGKNDKGSLP